MQYTKACGVLRSAARLGSRPGLENITRLCALLDNPQEKLHIIHVAGTNGKGSTCAMLAGMGTASGLKTGLFSSPFFEEYRESFSINGRMISKTEFSKTVFTVQEQARRMEAEGLAPTEFELLTACAFVWFLHQGCDLVVLETGMGGRLDSTNVIFSPLACVLTAISLDHTAYLGETPLAIAAEKCGIIKEGRPVIACPDQPPGVLALIQKTAQEKNAPLILPGPEKIKITEDGLFHTSFIYKGVPFQTGMPGLHQLQNAAVAIETARTLTAHTDLCIPENAVSEGLRNARLPARQEVFQTHPFILLDGAHNLQGICALAATIKSHLAGRKTAVIMGMLADKEYKSSIAQIAPLASLFIAAAPENPRALSAPDTAKCARAHLQNVSISSGVSEALLWAIDFAGSDGAVVVCGSLYLSLAARRELSGKNSLYNHFKL